MSVVIKTEDLSKLYRLGIVSTKSLVHDINRMWARITDKEDPYGKIDLHGQTGRKSNEKFLWALKDINFEINQGDITGIIGKNGAGKSTLLKILSRVTSPTSGSVKVKGRIASLLEVGTGFHQELTGRENIFLNGSILGMTKAEIKKKFDEILDFSGVEKFIDTPVKRYSSGMYVRLAFAVAAHLDPEILIVDEVLAVGDSEFQKKCIGKMHDVSSKEGRTVLFVSHNMGAIRNLCKSSILLEKGMIKNFGMTEDIISEYLNQDSNEKRSTAEFNTKDSSAYFKKISISSGKSEMPSAEIDVTSSFKILFEYCTKKNIPGLKLGFSVYSGKGVKIFYDSRDIVYPAESGGITNFLSEVIIPGNFLAPGNYYMNVILHIENIQSFDFKERAIVFDVIESGSAQHKLNGKDIGLVLADFEWNSGEKK